MIVAPLWGIESPRRQIKRIEENIKLSTLYRKEIFHINKRSFYEFMLGFDFSLKYGIGNTISNRPKSPIEHL